MNNSQTTSQGPSISVTQEGEPRFAAMRVRLLDVFEELRLVRDVITVSVEAMHAQMSDFDPDVGRVLFYYGAEKLFGQLESLSDIIEQLGGRTEFTNDREQTRAPLNREATNVGA